MVAHVVSTHLPPQKDRALATALFRVSERTGDQERNQAEKVVYCGNEEPIYGWTNAIPNPKLTDGTRPKPLTTRKRKGSRKPPKADPERYESPESIHLPSISSNVDGQYQSYATLRDMYDSYKKSMRHKSLTKPSDIVDPVTYKYVPWDERVEHDDGYSSDGSDIKLPEIKIVGKDPRRLMEVAQKYGGRSDSETVGNSKAGVNTSEFLGYYDKYKWNFKKDKHRAMNGSGFNRGRMNTRRKTEVDSVELPQLGANVEPSTKERLLRYVNGSVRHKRKNHAIYREAGKNAFYIKFHANKEKKESDVAGMIKFERKREKSTVPNGESVDRWVARVIIKNPDQTQDGAKRAPSEATSSSVVIVSDERWSRKTGVAESERERLQMEMQRNREEQRALMRRKKRAEKERGSQEERMGFRLRQKESHQSSTFSVVETAKVKMRYDVETTGKKGVVREIGDEVPVPKSMYTQPVLPAISREHRRNQSETSLEKQDLTIGKDHVTRIGPSSSSDAPPAGQDQEMLYHKQGKLFLNRGAAQRSVKGSRKGPSRPGTKVKLPVLPKQVPMERQGHDKKSKAKTGQGENEDRQSFAENGEEEGSEQPPEKSHLPVVMGTSVSSDADAGNRPHTPSSTFNSGRMMQQVLDTAQFLKSVPEKNEFIRYRVVQQPGLYSSSQSSTKSKDGRKPIHPPHNRNRGQDRIQGMIDHEKALVRSVIKQLTSNGALASKPELRERLNDEGGFKDVMSKARSLEEKATYIPHNLLSNNRGQVIMKRRVVPPIISTQPVVKETRTSELPKVATTQVGGQSELLFKNGTVVTSRARGIGSKAVKQAARAAETKRTKTERLNESPGDVIDSFVCSGDVLIKQRPTPKLLEHNFAASISSVKPARRVVNISNPRVKQKG